MAMPQQNQVARRPVNHRPAFNVRLDARPRRRRELFSRRASHGTRATVRRRRQWVSSGTRRTDPSAPHRPRESRRLCIDDGDVVSSTSVVGRRDQRIDDRLGIARMPPDQVLDGRRGHHVGQPIRAQQNRVVALECVLDDLDEPFLVLVAVVAADVAEDLVAPRVAHGFRLGNLARVLALADRRVIVRQLPDAARRQLVETAVAHMPDRDPPIDDECQRQHAGHAVVGRRFLEPA